MPVRILSVVLHTYVRGGTGINWKSITACQPTPTALQPGSGAASFPFPVMAVVAELHVLFPSLRLTEDADDDGMVAAASGSDDDLALPEDWGAWGAACDAGVVDRATLASQIEANTSILPAYQSSLQPELVLRVAVAQLHGIGFQLWPAAVVMCCGRANTLTASPRQPDCLFQPRPLHRYQLLPR